MCTCKQQADTNHKAVVTWNQSWVPGGISAFLLGGVVYCFPVSHSLLLELVLVALTKASVTLC